MNRRACVAGLGASFRCVRVTTWTDDVRAEIRRLLKDWRALLGREPEIARRIRRAVGVPRGCRHRHGVASAVELRGRVVAPCPIVRFSSRSVPGHDSETILDLNVGPNTIRLGADDAERSLPRLR